MLTPKDKIPEIIEKAFKNAEDLNPSQWNLLQLISYLYLVWTNKNNVNIDFSSINKIILEIKPILNKNKDPNPVVINNNEAPDIISLFTEGLNYFIENLFLNENKYITLK